MSQHQARKRFGQHFLVDDAMIENIVRAISPARDDNLVEIGPGLSALTRPLLQRLDRLRVIELDRDLAARLRREWPAERLAITEADALTVDFSAFGPGLRVVGNLPYNISTPILFHLMPFADQIRDQHFMLQREVVERMVARPGDDGYGRLAVMLQTRYRMHNLFEVPADAFDPPPRVVSAVVRMKPLPADRPRARDEALFADLVARAFGQRRKMLRRSLGDWATKVPWDALGIAPTARAEEVSVTGFQAMADALSDGGLGTAPGAAPPR
ncbi:MAG: 16S rRNA (adenine(1518)-N(6)/adenine(1519)-N(6))-dimethyltransferase RsmA [Pigmentiphaga sp.]